MHPTDLESIPAMDTQLKKRVWEAEEKNDIGWGVHPTTD